MTTIFIRGQKSDSTVGQFISALFQNVLEIKEQMEKRPKKWNLALQL